MKYLKLILIVVVLYGCKKNDTKVVDIPVISVTVATPETRNISNLISANGTINAWQETIISSQVSGLDISKIYVNVGDTVHKGDKLALLNPDQVKSDLMAQVANVAEAKANLEQSTTEARQAAFLEKAGAISAQDLLQYDTKQKTNKAKLEAAEATLKLQKLRLNYTVIIAPDNGVISSRTATVGSIVQNGSELFRLIRSNRLEWQAQTSPENILKIKPGQIANIISDDGSIIEGKVRQVSPILNQNTRNGMVYVDIPAHTTLKQGEYLSGTINLGEIKSQTIPSSALVNRDGFNYVMKVGKDNRIIQTKVDLLDYHIYSESYVPIALGVKPDDKIVSTGSGFLSDGDLVKVAPGGKQ
jgi:RND family efflux transporter MFP subunit